MYGVCGTVSPASVKEFFKYYGEIEGFSFKYQIAGVRQLSYTIRFEKAEACNQAFRMAHEDEYNNQDRLASSEDGITVEMCKGPAGEKRAGD